ncbi:hypothetical protein [Demequina lutea]|uniref:Lipoprotein n=1 Tax=Demequina lutea TaxID=431489 RepID=A0A7Z0CKN7_9MICO|nr:hypothetical protein [Demequina lutea]NYI42103.1 hypothetical protein [Demequina lutea]
MKSRTRLAAGSLVGVVLAITLTACGNKGDFSIDNSGPGDVTVLTGDEELIVPGQGGLSVLDYGCTPGDVTIRFASGQEVLLHGPVCPDQRIVVSGSTATLAPA